jgi:hypothetical protein
VHPLASFHTPQNGPSVFIPAQLNVSIPANTKLGPLNVIFPFYTFVYGLTLTTTEGAQAGSAGELANISIEVQDGDTNRIITDGQGWKLSVSGLSTMGLGPLMPSRLGAGHNRKFALQRLVQPREVWPIAINNDNAHSVTVEVGFIIGTPQGKEADAAVAAAHRIVRSVVKGFRNG